MKTESQRIGHYELRQRLGQGNAGETWRAYDNDAKRIVILKFYRTDLLDVADALTDYLENVERVAALHHPNIVHIYDIQLLAPRVTGEQSSLICLAVECVEGGTLANYIANTSAAGRTPPSTEVVNLISSIAIALDSAHQHGVIHGNLKPSNILLNQSAVGPGKLGTPMLTDFGATKFTPKKHGNDIPFYLAPEQVKGMVANERSDIYALGVLLYELYAGVPPFRGNRPIAVMMQHVNAQPTSPDLVNPGISPALAQVILRCLAKDPQARFPNAASLAVALANALHVPISENLRRSAILMGGTPPPMSFQDTARKVESPTPPAQDAFSARLPPKHRRPSRALILFTALSLVAILGAGFGSMLLMQRNTTASDLAHGQAFFLNSGQINQNTTQGINDELQIQISNLPDPAPGKSYYAWLLGDASQSEVAPFLLGRLTVEQGNVHFLYPGNAQHANLLAFASRFLINEDDTRSPSSNPLLDQSTWRYYGAIPSTPNSADKLHFSLLDHLRHLLVESPELAVRGLHGGLAFWFARDTASVSEVANSLSGDWQKKDASTIRDQVIRILDYLDGTAYIQPDVPSGTPFLADAQVAQVGMLGPAPQEAFPAGYVFQDEPPPGYVYLIQTHLNGAILAPQVTPEQRQLAIQINGGIDSVRRSLTQIYQDSKELLNMTNAQLLQAPALTLLDNIATQAQYAYTGQPNPTTGTVQNGALWIYNNLQRLTTFNVAPYKAS